ncbi:UNVERIFIED_CONTAM: hypothetical protein HDU68_010922 [Siphonaria sp. JEL0065]|nr:hypothetical protein HDU68_010922 [Siphonaria sp. JEL0065]
MSQSQIVQILSLLQTHELALKPGEVDKEKDDFVVVSAVNSRAEAQFEALFAQVFLVHSTHNDDLLFFVPNSNANASSNSDILVRRKMGEGVLPAGIDVKMVNWKETFFLNLIVQMHCSLTVSVCKRDSSQQKRMASLPGSEKILTSSSSDHTATSSHSHPQHHHPQPSSGSSPSKSRMVALRRITKKVYAAPYKSRMDVKDAFMNEIAYPLVYYTVNDYESTDLHLHIQEREYLCVELSVLVPSSVASSLDDLMNGSGGDALLDENGLRDSGSFNVDPNPPSVKEDSTPFPVPDGFKKVVLFQGAVPYTALLDVFLQKTSGGGGGGLSKPKSSSDWGNLNNKNSARNSQSSQPHAQQQERTEYIMMRGPRGKGVCQVAICENILSDPSIDSKLDAPQQLATATISPSSSGSSGLLNMLGGTVRTGYNLLKNGLNAVAGETGAGDNLSGGGSNSSGNALRKPDALRCSMTYVNVPWHSIISDLISAREAGTI